MLKIQNSVEVFENPIFGQIRMTMVDDEPMFCLIDVCRALEIKNATDVAKRLGTMPVVELADAIKIVKGGGVE